MPILEVELVLRPDEKIGTNLAANIAEGVAVTTGDEPGHVWVRLRTLERSQIAENSGGPPPGFYPVFVTVLHLHAPTGEALAEEVSQLTDAIAAACDRPASNVHLFYQADGAGRVSFGGRLAT